MVTKRLDVRNFYDETISEASEILRAEGIVAIPTETVYGLAASCYSDIAIKKVFEAKGRPQDNPLIVHISDMEMLQAVATDIPDCAYECARRFWPGPFTMVLNRGEGVAESVSAGLSTVAVRMPSDSTARDIIRKSGLPLAAPSANASGRPSPTTAQHVLDDLDGKIDAVVMGDDCTVGVESTVISLVGEVPRLLRPGAVTVEQLREVLPDIVVDGAVLSEIKAGEKVASPGMKYKHYAPATDVYLVEADSDSFVHFVNQKTDSVAICFSEEQEKIQIKKVIYGVACDEATLAKNIFAVLRDVDAFKVKSVYVHAPSKQGVGLAVYNRLIRAAAFRVIKL